MRTGRRFALAWAAVLLATLCVPALAQDIRGMEICTAERQMDRRTGCLQANIDLLQQMLVKQARETRDKLAGAARDLAGAKDEIAALKAALAKLQGEVAQMKAKGEAPGKK